MGKNNKQNKRSLRQASAPKKSSNGKPSQPKPFNKSISKKNTQPANKKSFQPASNKGSQPASKSNGHAAPHKKGVNGKKNALGEYNEYVGKSMFQMIPEGVDGDYKDNFAALGGDSEEEHIEEVEMDEDEVEMEGDYEGEDIEDEGDLE